MADAPAPTPIDELAALDLDELWRRVYGAAEPDALTLDAYIARMREAHRLWAEKDDERVRGK